PKDDEAFARAIDRGNAQDPTDKLLHEQVNGWEVMADDQKTIDAFKTAVGRDGPVLADDDSFSQAMHDYSDDALVKAYVTGKTVVDEIRKTAGPDEKDLLNDVGTLDWIAAALSTTSDGVRFDTTIRGTPGKLLRSSSQGNETPNFELSLPEQLPA